MSKRHQFHLGGAEIMATVRFMNACHFNGIDSIESLRASLASRAFWTFRGVGRATLAEANVIADNPQSADKRIATLEAQVAELAGLLRNALAIDTRDNPFRCPEADFEEDDACSEADCESCALRTASRSTLAKLEQR